MFTTLVQDLFLYLLDDDENALVLLNIVLFSCSHVLKVNVRY